MRCSSLKSGLLALGLAAAAAAGLAEPVKVAVFKTGFGARAVLDALKKDARTQPILLKAITIEDLMQADVLYVGSTSLEQPDQIKSIKIFVACGGGVIFNHSSCGRYCPETIFPDIAAKVVDRRDDTILMILDKSHPITQGLPAEYSHAFNDHLYLEPGPEGKTIIVDREKAPVVVIGEAGAGRVVFNGGLPGYFYDPTDYKQGEKSPEGAELQMLLNAIEWVAGNQRLSTLPPEEVSARGKKVESSLKFEELASFLPSTNWFGDEMLRGSYLTLPPVTEIGGRYFITYDGMSWLHTHRGYDNPVRHDFFINRLKIDILQLKWLGITDIIYWTDMYGEKLGRPKTGVPDLDPQWSGIDPLAELIRLAEPEGMNVWVAWHSCFRKKEYAEKYCAKNAEGVLYCYGSNYYVEDLLNPAVLKRCQMMMDEYAEKYKPLGNNFKGLFTLDELWFCYADFHEDDLPAMEKFCVDNFGEKLPDDILERLALRTRWNDPTDPWRRRYILFKQKVMTDFFRNLINYAHSRGLEMGVTTMYIPGRWFYGMDNFALSHLGADYIIGAVHEYPNSLQWTHIYQTWGYYTTHNLINGPGGLMFTFNHIWRLITYGNDPQYAQQFARHIYTMRMFADSQSLARTAFLENEPALEMLAPDAALPWNRLTTLFKSASRHQDVRRIYSQSADLFDKFKVLVATPYAVRGLPQQALDGLRKFAETGGTIVAIDSDWSTARGDMENEKNMTVEMAGITYQPAPASSFKLAQSAVGRRRSAGDPPDQPREIIGVSQTALMGNFTDRQPAMLQQRQRVLHPQPLQVGGWRQAHPRLETRG